MTLKHLFVATALFAATTAATAQDYPQNVVKLGLEPVISFAFNGAGGVPLFPQINLHYERMINARQGANVMIGIGIPSAVNDAALTSWGTSQSSSANTNDIKLTAGSLTSFEAVGEYRFYVSDQEGPRGFYVAPQLYYKNFNMGLTGSHNYTAATGGTVTSKDKVDLGLGMFGGGVQLGAQWLIADKVSIDWMFFGIGLSSNTLYAKGTTEEKAAVDKWLTDAQTAVGNNASAKTLGTAGLVYTADRNAGTIGISQSSLGVYFRTALSVGYAF